MSRLMFGFVALIVLVATGCGSGLPSLTGIVTMDGEPVDGVSLEFVPDDGRPSVALTDKEGKYKAVYTHGKNGIILGNHTVRFQKFGPSSDVSEEDEFTFATKNKGGDSVSLKGRKLEPRKITIDSGSNTINFELVK